MPALGRQYRLTIRNKTDDADLLVVSTVMGVGYPYIRSAPAGRGASVDPLSGQVGVAGYVIQVIDEEGVVELERFVYQEDLGFGTDIFLDPPVDYYHVIDPDVDNVAWVGAGSPPFFEDPPAIGLGAPGGLFAETGNWNLSLAEANAQAWREVRISGLVPGQVYHLTGTLLRGETSGSSYQSPTLVGVKLAQGAGNISAVGTSAKTLSVAERTAGTPVAFDVFAAANDDGVLYAAFGMFNGVNPEPNWNFYVDDVEFVVGAGGGFLDTWDTEIDDANAADWSLVTGERVYDSAAAIALDLDGAFTAGDDVFLQRTLGGLVPGRTYRLYQRIYNEDIPELDATFPQDEWTAPIQPGAGWDEQVANGAGEILLTVGFESPVTDTLTGRLFIDAIVVNEVVAGTSPRVVTAILTDAGGLPQVLGNRAIIAYDETGDDWTTLVDGFLNRMTLGNALLWDIEVGDTDRVEQQATLFGVTDLDLALPSALLGGPVPVGAGQVFGGQLDYGMPTFKVEAVDSTGDTRFVELVYEAGPLPPHIAGVNSGPVDGDPEAGKRVVNAAAVPLAVFQEHYAPNRRYWYYPALSCAVYNRDTGALVGTFTPISRALDTFEHVIANAFGDVADRGVGKSLVTAGVRFSIAWTGTTDPFTGEDQSGTAQPSVNDRYHILLYVNQVSAKAPFHLAGHPVDVAEAVADHLGIAVDATAAATTRTLLGDDLHVELRVKETRNAYAFLRDVLFGPFGFAWRVGTDGEREFFVTRLRDSTTPTVEFTEDDLRRPGQPAYDLREQSNVSRVIWAQKQYAVWASDSDSYDDRPVDGLVDADLTIRANLAPAYVANATERVLTYTIPGRVQSLTNANADWLDLFVNGMASTIYGRWYGGNAEADLHCVHTVTTLVGGYLVADVDHLPNAIVGQIPTSQRGGRQVVQVVQRTETPAGPILRVIKAGPDLGFHPVPLVPVLSIAATTNAPKKRAAVTVENFDAIVGTTYRVRIEFGTGATEPDGFAVAGYLGADLGGLAGNPDPDTLTLPAVDAGSRVWARARLERIVDGIPQLGAYSAVVNVDLTDLTAPSDFAAAQQGSTTVYDLTWTVGETDHPVVVQYREDGATGWITLGVFPPGTEATTFALPDPTADWDLRVFHREAAPYSGESGVDTATITAPGGSATQLDPPTDLAATVQGGSGTVQVCFTVGDDRAAWTEIESARETAVGAGTYGAYQVVEVVTAFFSNEGDRQCVTLQYPVDGRLNKVRARHLRNGLTASNYAAEVTFEPGVPGTGTGGAVPHALDDHTDVNVPSPSDGDVLQWDASPGEWVAAPGLTSPVGIADGGTGQTTKDEAFDALSPTTTKGDLIVHGDAGDNIRLPVGGTNGQVLTVDSGQAAGVKWGSAGAGSGGGTTLLDEVTVSGATELLLVTGFTDAFDDFEIHYRFTCGSDGEGIAMQTSTDGGSTWDAGASDYARASFGNESGAAAVATQSDTADSEIDLSSNIGNGAGEYGAGRITCYGFRSSALHKLIHAFAVSIPSGGGSQQRLRHGVRLSTTQVNGVRLFTLLGGTMTGYARLYGMAK